MPCEKPLLSIIVPVYNVENYLQKCIDSILAQTLTDFELILAFCGMWQMPQGLRLQSALS